MFAAGLTTARTATRILLLALAPRGWGETTFAVYLGQALREEGHEVCILTRTTTLPLFSKTNLVYEVLPDHMLGTLSGILDGLIAKFRPDALVLCDIVITERVFAQSGADPKRVLSCGLPVVGVDTWDGEMTGRSIDLFTRETFDVATWLEEIPLRIRPVPFLKPCRKGACRFLPNPNVALSRDRDRVRRDFGVGDNHQIVLFCTADWQHASYIGDAGRIARHVPLLLAQYIALLGSSVHLVHIGPHSYPLDAILGTRYHWLPPQSPSILDATIAASDLLLTANIAAATIAKALVARLPVVVIENSIKATCVKEVAIGLDIPLLPEVERWLTVTVPIYPFMVWPLGFRQYLAPVVDRNPYLNAVRTVELCAGSLVLKTMERLLFDAATRSQLCQQQTQYTESVQRLPTPSQLLHELLGSR